MKKKIVWAAILLALLGFISVLIGSTIKDTSSASERKPNYAACANGYEMYSVYNGQYRGYVEVRLDGKGEKGPAHTRMYKICHHNYNERRFVVVYSPDNNNFVVDSYIAYAEDIQALEAK